MMEAPAPKGAARGQNEQVGTAIVLSFPGPTQTAEHISPWLRRIAPYMRSRRDWMLLGIHRRRVALHRGAA